MPGVPLSPSRLARTAIATPLVLLLVTGCAGDEGDSDVAIPAPAGSASSPSPSPSPSAVRLGLGGAPLPAPQAQRNFEISFADDKASGDTGRLRVGVGETVSIRITSLRADEVHLHGYDLSAPVAVNRPAVLTFTATIPGVFQLELENLGRQLASLQVS